MILVRETTTVYYTITVHLRLYEYELLSFNHRLAMTKLIEQYSAQDNSVNNNLETTYAVMKQLASASTCEVSTALVAFTNTKKALSKSDCRVLGLFDTSMNRLSSRQ